MWAEECQVVSLIKSWLWYVTFTLVLDRETDLLMCLDLTLRTAACSIQEVKV